MISVKLNVFSNVLYMNSDLRILFPDKMMPDEKLKTLWLCHGDQVMRTTGYTIRKLQKSRTAIIWR